MYAITYLWLNYFICVLLHCSSLDASQESCLGTVENYEHTRDSWYYKKIHEWVSLWENKLNALPNINYILLQLFIPSAEWNHSIYIDWIKTLDNICMQVNIVENNNPMNIHVDQHVILTCEENLGLQHCFTLYSNPLISFSIINLKDDYIYFQKIYISKIALFSITKWYENL